VSAGIEKSAELLWTCAGYMETPLTAYNGLEKRHKAPDEKYNTLIRTNLKSYRRHENEIG